MSNPCKCTLNSDCFAKRGHKGMCYLLTAPAIHYENGQPDCSFRKEFREKEKGWVPKSSAEREWAESVKKTVSIL